MKKPEIGFAIFCSAILGLMALVILGFIYSTREMTYLEDQRHSYKLEMLEKVRETCANDDIRHFRVLPDGSLEVGC
ncbi:MAG: hypothetical protein GY861_03420 [bacterium]|nr:hypothetical protein [bacterium]